MKKNFPILLVLMLSFIIVSCDLLDKKKDEENGGTPTIAKINIQNAKALFIAASSSTEAKLYGIKGVNSGKSPSMKSPSDGEQVFEIMYFNENGDTITKKNPSYIFNLTNFIILSFGDQSNFTESYLISKESGSVFAIPSNLQPHLVGNKYAYSLMFPDGKDRIQEDESNMYYPW